jgi:hypothetical protein
MLPWHGKTTTRRRRRRRIKYKSERDPATTLYLYGKTTSMAIVCSCHCCVVAVGNAQGTIKCGFYPQSVCTHTIKTTKSNNKKSVS